MSSTKAPPIKTLANLEAAFSGESMAHIKYRYFARVARAHGDEETARLFEDTAGQELLHAFGHLDLLYPPDTLTSAKALQLAIEGETYEYSEMYPGFRATAQAEGNHAAAQEMQEQGEESRVHAAQFAARLAKAEKRFSALTRVEERHARHYRAQLDKIAR
jgi:rubrerythrin